MTKSSDKSPAQNRETSIDANTYESALEFHKYPTPGKLAIKATKSLGNQRDLSLAYSPGVAAPCEEIVRDPSLAADYTSRGNLVAVITNGTAVLGLGDIGPLAAKPVMEGKAVLFKKFAGIDSMDIEVNEKDPQKLVEIVASLEPSFGAINLEDIKAPECFYVERELKKRLKIPVFHDDQHGTAIIVAAAVKNALELVEKKFEDVKLVASGAGAASIACLDLLVKMGLSPKNITVCDAKGVVHKGRDNLDDQKARYAIETKARKLEEVIEGADIFLGLSVGNILKSEMVKKMAENPLILALANPCPEIDPHVAAEVRPDAIIATGRSDFANQVNNVLCFPFIFRGALDVGATEINDDMKLACVDAIADLAKAESTDVVSKAYNIEPRFGPDYIIPKPFDPRLITQIAPAVALAAMKSGVATRPIEDMAAYNLKLSQHIYQSSVAMRPIFTKARRTGQRVAFAEGEDERVLRAAQILIDENLVHPILIGRRRVVEMRLERLGLRLKLDKDVTLVDPEDDPRFNSYWHTYQSLMCRKGVSPEFAKTIVRTNTTVIGALMVVMGDADATLCGSVGRYRYHLENLENVIGLKNKVSTPYSLSLLTLDSGLVFIADGYAVQNPCEQELIEMTLLACDHVRQFAIEPKVALLSQSNFGTSDTPIASKMRRAVEELHRLAPALEVDGEMHADAALIESVRTAIFPDSKLKGRANVLITPDIQSAHIAINLLCSLAGAQRVGPILMGLKSSAHILTNSVSVRGIVNMATYAAVDALRRNERQQDIDMAALQGKIVG